MLRTLLDGARLCNELAPDGFHMNRDANNDIDLTQISIKGVG